MCKHKHMVDSTGNSGSQKEFAEAQSTSSLRAWVKPSFERLSLKDALTGPTGNADGTSHPGS
jgi:hypothetical protein